MIRGLIVVLCLLAFNFSMSSGLNIVREEKAWAKDKNSTSDDSRASKHAREALEDDEDDAERGLRCIKEHHGHGKHGRKHKKGHHEPCDRVEPPPEASPDD